MTDADDPTFDENPEWAGPEIEAAALAGELLPRQQAAALVKPNTWYEAIGPEEAVSLRLSPEVLRHFRATGPGWRARINETLKRAIAGQPTDAR